MFDTIIEILGLEVVGLELEKWLGQWEIDGINNYICRCWDINNVDELTYNTYIQEVTKAVGAYRIDTFIRDVCDLYDIDYYTIGVES